MKKDHIIGLVWALGIVGLAIGASVARHLGHIDQDTTQRIVLGATGLMIAALGNRMPKNFVSGVCARKVQRVAAWSMALSGLIYAGAFIFLPIMTAMVVGCGAVLVGMAATFGYALSLRAKAA